MVRYNYRMATDRSKLPLRPNCEGYFTDGKGNILARLPEQPGGYVIFPGGGIEPGEDPALALIRETLEETGAQVHIAKAFGSISYDWPEGWAQTDKQKRRWEQYKGDEMFFFAGTIDGFAPTGQDAQEEDAWPEPKLVPLSNAIAAVKAMQPFPPGLEVYYERQLQLLQSL